MQDADGSIPFFWGVDSENHLVFSDDAGLLKTGCGNSYAPFPKGNYNNRTPFLFQSSFMHKSSSSTCHFFSRTCLSFYLLYMSTPQVASTPPPVGCRASSTRCTRSRRCRAWTAKARCAAPPSRSTARARRSRTPASPVSAVPPTGPTSSDRLALFTIFLVPITPAAYYEVPSCVSDGSMRRFLPRFFHTCRTS